MSSASTLRDAPSNLSELDNKAMPNATPTPSGFVDPNESTYLKGKKLAAVFSTMMVRRT
jgi:hypothetical protein